MSDKENKVLDLDDLFGVSRPIKVKWQGKSYELLRLEAFSPKEILAFERLQVRAGRLQNAAGSKQKADDAEISALFDEMLGQLCKELPLAEMPFLAKTRIITFYIEETQGKKALEEALMKQPIGATSPAD